MRNQLHIILFFLVAFFQLNQMNAQEQPRTGLLFDDEAYEAQNFKEPGLNYIDETGPVPSVFSLKSYVPEIEDQGQYGTCVGWSTSYYAQTIAEAKRDDLTITSAITKRSYSPVYTYFHSNVSDDYNCQGGAYIQKALASLKKRGVPLFSDLNQDCITTIPDYIHELAAENKIKEFTPIFHTYSDTDSKVSAIKKSISSGYPVVIGIRTFSSLSNSTLYIPSGAEGGGHAVAIVGYDDDKEWTVGGKSLKGGIEIVNSWGKSTHDKGFFWVPYDYFEKVLKYGYELIPTDKKRTDFDKTQLSGELNFSLKNGEDISVNKKNSSYKNSISDDQINQYIGETPGNIVNKSIGYYKTNAQFPEDQQFSLDLKITKPAYVYMLTSDSNNKNGALFPKTGITSYVSSPSMIRFPRTEENFYFLGGDADYDRFITIISTKKINIEDVINKLNYLDGNLNDKLYNIFGDQLIKETDLNLKSSTVAFDAQFSEGSIGILVLEITRK